MFKGNTLLPSFNEALESFLEKAINDPTEGGKLIPVHIIDKNGHHTTKYKTREEAHNLKMSGEHHHVAELAPGHRFIHPKNGHGTITKVKGHDGKGYELVTKYDNGKTGTAYVHNVELTKPDHAPLPTGKVEPKKTEPTKKAEPKKEDEASRRRKLDQGLGYKDEQEKETSKLSKEDQIRVHRNKALAHMKDGQQHMSKSNEYGPKSEKGQHHSYEGKYHYQGAKYHSDKLTELGGSFGDKQEVSPSKKEGKLERNSKTKSGKEINIDHQAHSLKEYTAQDHKDAADHLSKLAESPVGNVSASYAKNQAHTHLQWAKHKDSDRYKQEQESEKQLAPFKAKAESDVSSVLGGLRHDVTVQSGNKFRVHIETGDRGPRTDHNGGDDGEDWMDDDQIESLRKPYVKKYKDRMDSIKQGMEKKGYKVDSIHLDYGEKGHISIQFSGSKK